MFLFYNVHNTIRCVERNTNHIFYHSRISIYTHIETGIYMAKTFAKLPL